MSKKSLLNFAIKSGAELDSMSDAELVTAFDLYLRENEMNVDSVMRDKIEKLRWDLVQRRAAESPGNGVCVMSVKQNDEPSLTLNGFPVVKDAEISQTRAAAEMDYGSPENACDKDCSDNMQPMVAGLSPVRLSGRDLTDALNLMVDCAAITVDELREMVGLSLIRDGRGDNIAQRRGN